MSRARWGWFIASVAMFTGCGLWAWFLAGRTLDVADRWSSVLASFAALAGLVMSALVLLLGGGGGARSVHIGGDATGIFTMGDHSPIDRPER